jgi:hypothetical protein
MNGLAYLVKTSSVWPKSGIFEIMVVLNYDCWFVWRIVDNVQRSDLPIGDKLRWLLKFADQGEGKGREIGWRDLVDTLGLSRSQSDEWLTVVQSRNDEYVKKIIDKVFLVTTSFSRLIEISKADLFKRELIYNKWYGSRPAPDTNALKG